MINLIAIGGFGLVGVFSRYFVDQVAGKWFEVFPTGILLINILGSLVAGIVYVMGTERSLLSSHLSVGLLVGFCGGFTTFSAYSLQSVLLLEKGNLVQGIVYLSLSPVLGLLGAFCGVTMARAL